jgi:hypothetical protein
MHEFLSSIWVLGRAGQLFNEMLKRVHDELFDETLK